ncbi:replication-relaxation family protein [Amycolatopsis sp. NBC_01488]|uniref:replication-relaxation family protein n=1 Tax=Amycolatopsis sp. NBC_01488 TaxID=2903563 RepID=UPI002E2B9E55|nr:replication-relaxation family protein [Amycolatopsis sp. NBC_01488]
MTAARLRGRALERILDSLSDRDRAILVDVGRNRVLSGAQLSRLHFVTIAPTARDRIRRKVLARLVTLGVLAILDRRVGGARSGSDGLVFAPGIAGQRVLPLLAAESAVKLPTRARRPWTPGERFLKHSLDVSELGVQLREQEQTGAVTLARWAVEATAAYPNGFGGLMKPDASLLLQAGNIEDSWVIELDRATESLPTLRHKLLAYVDFANAGQVGPDGTIPRVLVVVSHEKPLVIENRLKAIQELVSGLPDPADRLIHAVRFEQAVPHLVNVLDG